MQSSVATDITDSEAHGYSIAGILAEVIRGRLEDMGLPLTTIHATCIGVDNDAVQRIASDAASAKRALHILRRLGHTRWLTDQEVIAAIKVVRDLNLADIGTHYTTAAILKRFERHTRGEPGE